MSDLGADLKLFLVKNLVLHGIDSNLFKIFLVLLVAGNKSRAFATKSFQNCADLLCRNIVSRALP